MKPPPFPGTAARLAGRRPTLADVAAEAGVSRATASRALASSPLVSPATRERVGQVAERLGFEPNRLARSLRRGATMGVGLVVPDIAAAFYAAALKGAQEVLEDAGRHVLVMNTDRDAARERAALATLRAHQVDGLILATSGGYEEVGVPVVFFDNVPADERGPAVAVDNAGGIELLVDHLARVHGHERVAYVGETAVLAADGRPHGAGRERLEGFRAGLARVGLADEPALVRTTRAGGSETAGRVMAHELLALGRPPTAIVAGTDGLAAGVLRGLRDMARRVPEDVALVSFDELVYADLLTPPVTSLDRHDAELGRRAAELLLRRLEKGEETSPRAEVRAVRVPLSLILRCSCGCGSDLTAGRVTA